MMSKKIEIVALEQVKGGWNHNLHLL